MAEPAPRRTPDNPLRFSLTMMSSQASWCDDEEFSADGARSGWLIRADLDVGPLAHPVDVPYVLAVRGKRYDLA